MFRERWKTSLRRVINDMRSSATPREYALGRLQELVHPPSKIDLVEELTKLVKERKVQVIYRVVSPTTGAGILETSDITDVPTDVLDDTTGVHFHVDPLANLEIVYRALGN